MILQTREYIFLLSSLEVLQRRVPKICVIEFIYLCHRIYSIPRYLSTVKAKFCFVCIGFGGLVSSFMIGLLRLRKFFILHQDAVRYFSKLIESQNFLHLMLFLCSFSD